MLLTNRTALLGITLLAALGIGFTMQMATTPRAGDVPPEPLEVTGIALTAATAPAALTTATVTSEETPEAIPVAAEVDAPAAPPARIEPVAQVAMAEADAAEDGCAITLESAPRPAAMVELSLVAPCLPGSAVTFHHNGMMFSDRTDEAGTLTRTVPALAPKAVFIASFATGDGAVTQIDVASLNAYDRIVVQWKGREAGLGLHALEYDAAYWQPGHVWADAPGTALAAAEGSGGLITRLGLPEGDAPLMAEIYTFPTRMAPNPGAVRLSVEAEITAANCESQVDAQTLEYRQPGALRVQDLTLFMPECGSVGDFLVLNNLIEDLTIAQR